jgi:putative transposase
MNATMAEYRTFVLEMLRMAIRDGDLDVLREGIRLLTQAVIEADVTKLTGVSKGKRDPERRLTNLTGTASAVGMSGTGRSELSIPKVRVGLYFPSLPESRRRAEQGLLSVVQEVSLLGVSTSRFEALFDALETASFQPEQVSQVCAALDADVQAFPRGRLRDAGYPNLLAPCHVRPGPRGREGGDDGGGREQRGEWQDGRRCFGPATMALIDGSSTRSRRARAVDGELIDSARR